MQKKLAVGAVLAFAMLVGVFAIPRWTEFSQSDRTVASSGSRPNDTEQKDQSAGPITKDTPPAPKASVRGGESSGKAPRVVAPLGLAPDDYTLLSAYKITIYVRERSPELIAQAKDMSARLVDHLAKYGVKPRLQVAPRDRAFFHDTVFPPKGYEIRYEPQSEHTQGEREAAEQLRSALAALYPTTVFNLVPVTNRIPNPNFMSIFLPLR